MPLTNINSSTTMVEDDKEYILQWPGHAAYVSERFSGLLARQTLVDITLICDEQKLRVHKLVLASCSLYFEEMLTEDLGPEPVILLRDLNFSILKAMIEFMYCGETTVSHTHLPSLLTAARLFKVKELESLVEKMLGIQTQDHNDNNEEYLFKDVASGNGIVNGLVNTEDNGIRVFSNKVTSGDGQSSFDEHTESSDSESEKNYFEENVDSPNESCLYEDETCNVSNDRLSKTVRNGEFTRERNNLLYREKSTDSESDSSSTMDSENCEKDSDGMMYERCCNFVNNGCAKSEENSQYLNADCLETEVTNRVGQCARVYTHKKRKVSNGDNGLKRHARDLEKQLPQQLSSSRIDLTDDSSDEAPITLKTNLDVESSDYLLSFSTESIQSIVGCSLSDFCSSNAFELLNARTRLEENEDSAEEDEGEEDRPPVLRRSVRLNQQETEENYSRKKRLKSKLRDDKKAQNSNIKLISRTKRKNKEMERRVPNVKVIVSTPPNRKKENQSRPHRRSSKLAGRCNSNTKSTHLPKNQEKEISKPKTMEKGSTEKTEISENNNQPSDSGKMNTSASVNRALWGDMSDVAEDGELNDEFLEYSTSAEIPFAVGLLPLRAALERMQATLDHQPRKTRSSVASTKQESMSNLKRKSSPSQQEVPLSKKQNCSNSAEGENASAVCHIQIRTSSQCSRPRKRSLSESVTTNLEQTAVGDKQ